MFQQSLSNLLRPPNTHFQWEPGAEIALGRESIAKSALERGSEWVWYVDDDQTFEADALLSLLRHDVPVVGALYLQRQAPFYPVARREVNGELVPLDIHQCPQHGLISVDGIGTGGLLVKTEVFRALKQPWFQLTSELSEDLFFCRRVRRELNLPIYADPDVPLGHICPAVVFPLYDEGKWVTGLSYARSVTALFPIGNT